MKPGHWTKSSYSKGGADNCVECRTDQGRVLIRDVQNRELGYLSVAAAEWRALVAAACEEEL